MKFLVMWDLALSRPSTGVIHAVLREQGER